MFDGLSSHSPSPLVQQPSVGFDFDGVFVEDARFYTGFGLAVKLNPVRAFASSFEKVGPVCYEGDMPEVCRYLSAMPIGSTIAVVTGRVADEYELTSRQLIETAGGTFLAKGMRVMLFVNEGRKSRTRAETPELAAIKTVMHKAMTINSLGLEVFYESDQGQVEKLSVLCPNTRVLKFKPFDLEV